MNVEGKYFSLLMMMVLLWADIHVEQAEKYVWPTDLIVDWI